MRGFSRAFATLILLMVYLPAGAQEQDWTKVELKVERVRGNIYVIDGGSMNLEAFSGGNIGVSVGEDGILIVDDKFAPLAERIRAAFAEMGGGELQFILNTHWHGDHTGANAVFGPEAPIIAHTNVRKRLVEGGKILGRENPPAPKAAWPVITFDHSVSIHFNGEEIQALHYPRGHTDGDTVVFFTGSNVVHLGDDFFVGVFPFVDLESGGTVEGLTRNIGQVLEKLPADVRIIPGHGPVATLDDLRTYHRMLVETTDHIRRQRAAGKTLEEIKTAGLPEEWQGWSWGFVPTERWIETVYTSLSAGK